MKNHFIELVRNVFINTYILFCVSKDKREWLLSRHLSDFSFYNNFKFYFAIFKKLIKRGAYFIQRYYKRNFVSFVKKTIFNNEESFYRTVYEMCSRIRIYCSVFSKGKREWLLSRHLSEIRWPTIRIYVDQCNLIISIISRWLCANETAFSLPECK